MSTMKWFTERCKRVSEIYGSADTSGCSAPRPGSTAGEHARWVEPSHAVRGPDQAGRRAAGRPAPGRGHGRRGHAGVPPEPPAVALPGGQRRAVGGVRAGVAGERRRPPGGVPCALPDQPGRRRPERLRPVVRLPGPEPPGRRHHGRRRPRRPPGQPPRRRPGAPPRRRRHRPAGRTRPVGLPDPAGEHRRRRRHHRPVVRGTGPRHRLRRRPSRPRHLPRHPARLGLGHGVRHRRCRRRPGTTSTTPWASIGWPASTSTTPRWPGVPASTATTTPAAATWARPRSGPCSATPPSRASPPSWRCRAPTTAAPTPTSWPWCAGCTPKGWRCGHRRPRRQPLGHR